MAKKKKGPIIKKGLDDWMATYADMVTLLFCFFVMLYSAASVDDVRFQYILQVFRSDGAFINTIVGRPQDASEQTAEGGVSDIPMDTIGEEIGNPLGATTNPFIFDSLFNELVEIAENPDMADMMDVSATPGRIRIKLASELMFDGNSAVINDAGRRALTILAPAIKGTEDAIKDIQVQGHTADVGSPGFGINDWELSSQRAVNTVIFMEGVNTASSDKFQSEGFAQHRPIAPNDTDEGRSQNRRVEIIINRRMDISPEEDRRATATMVHDFGHPLFGIDAEGRGIEPPGTAVSSVVHGILGDLESRYGEPAIITRPRDFNITPTPPIIGPSRPTGRGQTGFVDIRDSDFLPVEEIAPESDENDEQLTVDNG
jgi:chemotaxis protein MotB